MTMKTSAAGAALIKRFEGLRLDAYQDVAGVWTIGYGHTAGFRDGRFGPASTITAAAADALLWEDLVGVEANLNMWASIKGVGLREHEFDALASFVFNVGFAAFERSTAARRLIAGDRPGAAQALTWWDRATVGGEKVVVAGLRRRRQAEKALFLDGDNGDGGQ